MKSNKLLEINEQELIKDITQIKKPRALNVELTQIKYVIRPDKKEQKKRTKKTINKRINRCIKKDPDTLKNMKK